MQDALRASLDGDGILFVGGGLSFLSKNAQGEHLPDAMHLVDLLLNQPAGTGSKHKLDRIAGEAIRKKGVDFVYDVISKRYTVTASDERLKAVVNIPWKRIYTTNYDNAIQIARAGVRPVSTLTLDDAPSSATVGSIVHLNGFVKQVSPSNLESGLLLSDSSYADSRLLETGWLSALERDLRTSRAIIFAGYSLYDLDIERVLVKAEGTDRKAYFFVSPDADEIEVSTLQRFGTVVPGGVDALVAQIGAVSIGYRPPQFATGLTALRELRQEPEYRRGLAVTKINEQLVYGVLPEQEVLADQFVFEDQRFLVRRSQIEKAIEAVDQGPWRDILITGEIASGKSSSTLDLARHFIDKGYRVYYAEKTPSLMGDLRRIADIGEKVVVIFDGYSPFRPEISDYLGRRPLTHRLVLTERSGIQQFIEGFVSSEVGIGPVFEIELDIISAKDIPQFEALTNFGGFWEERAGASALARQRYISDRLEGSLYRLLLEIIRSKKVQDSVKKLLAPVSVDRSAARIFCSALIVNALRFEFAISEWQYWFDRQAVRRLANAFSEQVRHFMHFDASRIYVRSGMLSLEVLHTFVDNDLVRDCLIDLYTHAERSSAHGGKWYSLMIELMKFSSIEPMFAGGAKAAFVFDYYDRIRALGSTVNNPDYWLQAGIAATVFDDLDRAERCFKNAYARERAKSKPNLTKIDNYAARFEMKAATSQIDPNIAFDQFISANEKLGRQIFLDINRHYPFKAGRHFAVMASKHYDKWSEKQQAQFKVASKNIRNWAIEWKTTKNEVSPDVEILIKEINQLLSRIG